MFYFFETLIAPFTGAYLSPLRRCRVFEFFGNIVRLGGYFCLMLKLTQQRVTP
jgi:hypothetical protein